MANGEDKGAVCRTKFKLHDKKGALVDLGKHLGTFKPDAAEIGHVTINMNFGQRPPEQAKVIDGTAQVVEDPAKLPSHEDSRIAWNLDGKPRDRVD